MRIYCSMIETKLLYALSCCCFTVAQQRRLNGFRAKCIRQVVGIKPSYMSRISNKEVLRRANHVAASALHVQTQLQLLGKVLRAPATSQLHKAALVPGTLQPSSSEFIRKVGRPRREWATTALGEALRQTHGPRTLLSLASDHKGWKEAMKIC